MRQAVVERAVGDAHLEKRREREQSRDDGRHFGASSEVAAQAVVAATYRLVGEQNRRHVRTDRDEEKAHKERRRARPRREVRLGARYPGILPATTAPTTVPMKKGVTSEENAKMAPRSRCQ